MRSTDENLSGLLIVCPGCLGPCGPTHASVALLSTQGRNLGRILVRCILLVEQESVPELGPVEAPRRPSHVRLQVRRRHEPALRDHRRTYFLAAHRPPQSVPSATLEQHSNSEPHSLTALTGRRRNSLIEPLVCPNRRIAADSEPNRQRLGALRPHRANFGRWCQAAIRNKVPVKA